MAAKGAPAEVLTAPGSDTVFQNAGGAAAPAAPATGMAIIETIDTTSIWTRRNRIFGLVIPRSTT